MLIRLGDVIYWIAAVCAVLWFGVGIWVYNVDPNPPSEATFVLLMFIGTAVLIYAGDGASGTSYPARRTSPDAKARRPGAGCPPRRAVIFSPALNYDVPKDVGPLTRCRT